MPSRSKKPPAESKPKRARKPAPKQRETVTEPLQHKGSEAIAKPAGQPLRIKFRVDEWPYRQHDGKWLMWLELRYEHAAILFDELRKGIDPTLEAFSDRVFRPGWQDEEYTTEKGVTFLKRILETFAWQEVIEWPVADDPPAGA